PPYPAPPVPPVPVPPPADTGGTRGVLWSFVPLFTFGFGTPFSFLYAAVRRRSWKLAAASLGYGSALSLMLALQHVGDPILEFTAQTMTLVLWISGTVHAFAVRPWVFPRPAPRSRANQYAVQVAKYRRTLREEARTLAAEDPALAHELRIGRPDLPRTYDDGGLVDVNHAPPQALATLPGMTPELVDKIVRRRAEQGGFISAEELSVDLDLPPGLLPQLSEYAIFLP
ncbi:MAG: helix-hairpin-helix domain-containing protein, partial [Actinomadura rubrobrunea]|nr:helix-hairpin-helix domain-containing protein [Actinomadura rubrobrunea]